MEKLIMIFEDRLRKWGAYIIGIPIFLMAIIETLNAFGRKLWIPFPCAVETVESLLVITTYFGASIVAIERGHVNVDLVTRKLPRPVQNYVAIFADVVGAAVFGLLTWGAWRKRTLCSENYGGTTGCLQVSSLAFQAAFCLWFDASRHSTCH